MRLSFRAFAAFVTIGLLGASSPAIARKLPATGQTASYTAGDDGAVRAGGPLSYKDKGDGTIKDKNTGLVWEAKTSCDGVIAPADLHDGDNVYPWAGFCSTSATVFCSTAADCPSGETCEARGGFCNSEPAHGQFCMTDTDCPGPASCYDERFDGQGYCSRSGEECGSADDCESDETCICSECTNGGLHCSTSGLSCRVDAECPSGETCVAGDTTIFQWVATLNAQKFAGHSDWRVPNLKELQSIVDYGAQQPAVAGAFNSGSASCTVGGFSKFYWSSTTEPSQFGANNALGIGFGLGWEQNRPFKASDFHIRAVRGGFTPR